MELLFPFFKSSNIPFCTPHSFAFVTSHIDLLSYLLQWNDATTTVIALNGMSHYDPLMETLVAAKNSAVVSVPYAFSEVRAFGFRGTYRNSLQLSAISIFKHGIVYEFFFSWLILALIFSNLIWCVEKKRNPKDFSPSYFRGLYDSFYFTAVTSLTIGFGDKAPGTGVGKGIVLFWILISFFFVFFFNSTLTTFITLTQMFPESVTSYVGRAVATFPLSSSADLLYGANADVKIINSNVSSISRFFNDYPNGS